MMICPLCNNEADIILTSKLRKGENRNVYYCNECDLGLLDDSMTEEELKAYYQESYREDYKPNLKDETSPEDLFNTYVNFQHDRLRLITPYLDKTKRLLEIGCSAGMFLYHVKDKLKEVVGIDFDINATRYASSICECEVYTEELGNTPLEENSFDIICAFQVLEHVKLPFNFLSQIKKYLKNDGVLYIEVPNLHDVLVSTYNLPHHYQFFFHSAHLYYFSKRSLTKLFNKVGFVGEFFYTQDYNIVNHFNWLLNDRPQSDCIPGLSTPKFIIRDEVKDEVKDQLNSFIVRLDKEYKELLSKLELTSNISFIGHKEKL